MTVNVMVLDTEPRLAVIVMVWVEVTALVVTANVAAFRPAGTVTPEGTVAALPLVRSVTRTPPAGAEPESTTTPLVLVPPVTDKLDKPRLESVTVGGLSVRVVVRATPAYVAVIVSVWLEVTALVGTVKVADVCPAATRTAKGACAPMLTCTSIPPVGAGPDRVIVPIAD